MEINQLIQNNVGAICTATVSVLAITSSAYITNKQIKQNRITTIEKEWVEKIRMYIANCLLRGDDIASYKILFGKEVSTDERQRDIFDQARREYLSTMSALKLYLNMLDGEHIDLFLRVESLYEKSLEGDMKAIGDLTIEILSYSHHIINKKLGIKSDN